MGKVLAIVGRTGTGKSTAIHTLNPDETFIIKAANKPLPFRGSEKNYNKDKKNMHYAQSWEEVLSIMPKISGLPHIKNLILDDLGHIMINEFFARSRESGYVKYTDIGLHMQQIILQATQQRDDLKVVLVFHEEFTDEVNGLVEKKVKTVGKLLDNYYDPLESVAIALFTSLEYSKEKGGRPEFSFVTNRCVVNGVEIPAKSPYGMFEDLKIPNDLNYVFQKMDEYFNG